MTRKVILAALASAAPFVALPPAANATPVTPVVSSEGVVAFDNASTNVQVSSPCFQYSSVGATVGCSGSTTTPTTGSTLNYLTTATASYGVLKAAGQSSITGASGTANLTDYSTSYGQAYFEDSWLITGGSGTGTLQLLFGLDGSYNFCGIHSGLVLGFSLANLDGGPSSSGTPSLSGCSGSIATTKILTTTFTFGSALDFLVSLTAGSNLYDLGNNISSNIDFSDTATMTAIVVKDAAGNVIPFGLTTASGASLFSGLAPSPSPTGVPEPMTLALFGAGLAGLTAVRRRARA